MRAQKPLISGLSVHSIGRFEGRSCSLRRRRPQVRILSSAAAPGEEDNFVYSIASKTLLMQETRRAAGNGLNLVSGARAP